MRISKLLLWADGKWQWMNRFMEPLNAFLRILKGQSLTDQQIMKGKNFKRQQDVMKILLGDILKSQISDTDTTSPRYILDLALFHHSSTPKVRLLYHELLLEYKWLHSILVADSGRTLDITNIAILFCQSETITFLMPHRRELTQEEWDSFLNGLESVSKMALPMSIEIEWPSRIPIAAKTTFNDSQNVEKLKKLKWRSHFHMNRTVNFENGSDFEESKTAEGAFKLAVESVIADLSDISADRLQEKLQEAKNSGNVLRYQPPHPVTYDSDGSAVSTEGLMGIIDRGLKRWYRYCGRGAEYHSLFANWCQESMLCITKQEVLCRIQGLVVEIVPNYGKFNIPELLRSVANLAETQP